MDKFKTEMMVGFSKYYEELNSKVAEELLSQENQQNDLHKKIQDYELRIEELKSLMEKRKKIKLTSLENLTSLRLKSKIFRFLVNFQIQRRNFKTMNKIIENIYNEKQKRKCLNILKSNSILQKTQQFEEKMKIKTEQELKTLKDGLEKQKEELLNLIIKAQEKLKHENRKKVQTKLQLDQIVLRGVSALNLKALKLSQNSLNGNVYLISQT